MIYKRSNKQLIKLYVPGYLLQLLLELEFYHFLIEASKGITPPSSNLLELDSLFVEDVLLGVATVSSFILSTIRSL